MLIVTTKHQQREILIGCIQQPVKTSRFDQAERARRQVTRLQTTIAIRQFTPVTNKHQSSAFHHEKDFLVIPMPMQSNTAARPQYVEVQVIHREELFLNWIRIFFPVRIKHPWIHLPTHFLKHVVPEIVREQIAVMKIPNSAMWTLADAYPKIVFPAAVDHVELVMIVGAPLRVPDFAFSVRPGQFQRQWQHRMHSVRASDLRHLEPILPLARQFGQSPLYQVRSNYQFASIERRGTFG